MQLLRNLVLPAALIMTAPQLVGAQRSPVRETEIGISAGLSAMPDALSTQCGSKVNGDGAGGAELGMSMLRRFGHNLAVQADTRLVASIPMFGCYAVLPAVDTSYATSLIRDPLATSTIRVAVETPRAMPLFRLSAGTGLAWGAPTLPVGVLALTWSSRGEGKRFFVEWERLQTRVHAEERYNLPSAGQAPHRRAIVTYPVGHTLRFGVTMPQD